MLARHYDSMGRTTSMYTHSVGPTRRPRVHRQPNQPTPLNHQDPCTTRPPTHRHLGVHHFGSALPTQRAENGASQPANANAMVAEGITSPLVLLAEGEPARDVLLLSFNANLGFFE